MKKTPEYFYAFLDEEKEEINIIKNLISYFPNITGDNNINNINNISNINNINISLELDCQDSQQNPNGFHDCSSILEISFNNEKNESNKKLFDDSPKELENKNDKNLLAEIPKEEENNKFDKSLFDNFQEEKDSAFNFDRFISEKSFFNKSYPLNLGLNTEENQNIIKNLKKPEPKENGLEPKNTISDKKESSLFTGSLDKNNVIEKYGLGNYINKNISVPEKINSPSNSSSTKESTLNKSKIIDKKHPFNIIHVGENFLKSNLDKSSINLFSNINRKRKREKILKAKPKHKIENLEKPILRNFIKFALTHSNDKTISKLINADKPFFDELLKKNKGRGGTDFLFVFNDKGKIHKFKSYNQKLMDYIFSKEECYKLYEIYKRVEAFYERYPLKKKGEKGKDVINKFHPNFGNIEDFRQKFNLIYKYHIK